MLLAEFDALEDLAVHEGLAQADQHHVFARAGRALNQTLEDLVASIGDCQVAVGRELTKVHEEMVRGPISRVLGLLAKPRGEYTVVVDIGQLPHDKTIGRPTDTEMHVLFGELTNNRQQTRRGAVTALAKRFRLPAREVYAAIERARGSVE